MTGAIYNLISHPFLFHLSLFIKKKKLIPPKKGGTNCQIVNLPIGSINP